jgi:hypothetical protein
MGIAGHVSRRTLEKYSKVLRRPFEDKAQVPEKLAHSGKNGGLWHKP